MAITLDGTTGITAPGVTDTGNLSVTGTSTLTGAVSQTSSSTAASFIPTGSTVPANGMYLSAANTLNLATNTTNQVSISSGGIVTGTAGNLMLVQGTSQASTSGTVIDFTGIPSWVKRITVMLNGVSTNGSSIPQIQIGAGSVSTSGYSCSAGYASNGAASSVAAATSGMTLSGSSSLTSAYSGVVTITLLGSNIWVFSWSGTQGTTTFNGGGGSSPALSGALDRVRVTTVNGTDTFDAGTINIQYE